jgi:hypothetical protein
MSTFQEKLDEFYLNYDTASLLKEDAEATEIVQMFKDELEYPEELTNALLRFSKTYLKSVVMRIKVRQAKLSNDELKSDILKYNKDLSPILDKLLNDKFKKQYEEVTTTKVEKKTINELFEGQIADKPVQQQKEAEDDEEETEDVEDEVIDDEEDELSNEELLKQFLSQKVEEDDSGELKLVEIFESFNNYCSENEYEYLKASTFKKLLRAEWGKAEGKGEKSLYRGYQFC